MTVDLTAESTARTAYAFSNSVPEAPQQLGALAGYLDPITTAQLAETGIGAGAQCLELGPGAGSVARWLAERAGPTGRVVVVDRDPSQLPPIPELEILRHDLQQGLPGELAQRRFDLIHARLVLVHLPNRHQLLAQLVAALAPGGWLVVGEFSGHPLVVHTAAAEADAALFTKAIDRFRDLLVAENGVDLGWSGQLHQVLVEAGLAEVKTVEYAESWTGGDAGCQLHVANLGQLAGRLTATGLTEPELARFHELMADPRFCARSWQFVGTRGRRP